MSILYKYGHSFFMITDEDILSFVCGKSHKNIQRKKLNNLPEEMKNYLMNRYNDTLSIRESVIRIIKNIDVHPLCPICGKPVVLNEYKPYFEDTCGDKTCILQLQNIRTQQTSIKRRGYAYSFQNKDVCNKAVELAHTPENIKKAEETCIKKYGVGNGRNKNKALQTNLILYNDMFYNNSKKAYETKIKRYNDGYYNNISKCKRTKLERYGDENYINTDKMRETCLIKYGVENVFMSKEIQKKAKEAHITKHGTLYHKDKLIETCIKRYNCKNAGGTKESLKKIKDTCLKRYGVDSYSKTDEFKIYISKIGSSQDVLHKKYKTHKRNNSFNKSKSEDMCYEILLTKFSADDIERQYTSDLYPFNCDFYIKSLNLYIEFNGSQYHHKHPFDKNNIDDINELNNLKERAEQSERHKEGKQSQYDKIIYTWTDLDIRKRNIAKENNLNYLECWNLDDVDKFTKGIE